MTDRGASEWERVDKAAFLTLDEQREAVGYGPAPKDAAFLKRGGDSLELRYAPDQPRAPAGLPDGRQWTSGGGGSGGSDSEDIAHNLDRDVGRAIDSHIERIQHGRFSVDLAEEEAQGGHAIARHVSRSKEQLIQRADRNRIGLGKFGLYEDRVGSFTSLLAANSLVNETLARLESTVNDVVAGKAARAVLKAWFDKPTGYESYRRRFHDKVVIRDTSGVLVVIQRAPHLTKGFVVITAFPINP